MRALLALSLLTAAFALFRTQRLLSGTRLLQISNDGSGKKDGGTSDQTRMILVFLLTSVLLGSCCGLIQLILWFSKNYKASMSMLRRNYESRKNVLQRLPA